MSAESSPQRKVTIRLTPFQARKLWELRTQGLPEGARPRSATQILIEALLTHAENTQQESRKDRAAS
jgi:hypothetical protein